MHFDCWQFWALPGLNSGRGCQLHVKTCSWMTEKKGMTSEMAEVDDIDVDDTDTRKAENQ